MLYSLITSSDYFGLLTTHQQKEKWFCALSLYTSHASDRWLVPPAESKEIKGWSVWESIFLCKNTRIFKVAFFEYHCKISLQEESFLFWITLLLKLHWSPEACLLVVPETLSFVAVCIRWFQYLHYIPSSSCPFIITTFFLLKYSMILQKNTPEKMYSQNLKRNANQKSHLEIESPIQRYSELEVWLMTAYIRWIQKDL